MKNFSLLDSALQSAKELLNSTKATHRLTDIDVEEVSIVDRAANKHTFIVVKRNVGKASAPTKGTDKEKLRSMQKSRAKEYGIEILESGSNLSFPSGYPTRLVEYGDPTNLKFPVDTVKRARNARVRFKQFAGNYKKTSSKRVVHERIVRAELKFGIKPKYDSKDPLDKLLPSSLRERMEEVTNKSEDKEMNIIDSIAKSLTQMTAFAELLKEAATQEDGTLELTDELRSALSSISSDIAKTYAEYGLAKASDDVIQAVESLVEISQMSLLLAEEIAVEGSISDDSSGQMTKISTLVGSLTKAEEESSAASDDKSEEEDEDNSDVNKEDESEETSSEESSESEDSNSEEDAGSEDGEGATEEETAKSEDDPSQIQELIAQVGKLTEAVGVLMDLHKAEHEEEGTDEDEDSDEEDNVQDQLEKMRAEKAALEAKLRKATEDPPVRGSSGRGVNGKSEEEEAKPQLFPLDYNA